MKNLILFLLASFTSICLAAPIDRVVEELDIREAAYRHQFPNNGVVVGYSAYFLSIESGQNGADPDDAFMKRFAGETPPVRKLSACDTSKRDGAFDKETGKSGIIFSTGSIEWLSDTEVKLPVGHYQGSTSSSGSTYYLQKIDGKWKVVKSVLQYVS